MLRNELLEFTLEICRTQLEDGDESKRTEAADVLMRNAFLAPRLTKEDLVNIMQKVPQREVEAAGLMLFHPKADPGDILLSAKACPQLIERAGKVLSEMDNTKRSDLREYERLSRREIFFYEIATNIHHFWWPHYAYDTELRKNKEEIPISFHANYHQFFLAACQPIDARKCLIGKCAYSSVCCYYDSEIVFPRAPIPQPAPA